MNTGLLTKDEFVKLLLELKGWKSVSQFARESDVTPQFMGEVLKGNCNPGGNVANAHGYEQVVMFRRITPKGNSKRKEG